MQDRTMTKAVLWDLDDTLYSRRDAARKTFPGMFRALLYPGQTDAFLEEAADYMMTQVPRNSMIHEDAFRALLAKYPPEMPYVRAGCVEYYYTHLRRFVAPSPEPLAVVRKLKELGIKNAIVTNITPELLESQHKKVEALGFAHLFDEIIYSAEFGIHKPLPFWGWRTTNAFSWAMTRIRTFWAHGTQAWKPCGWTVGRTAADFRMIPMSTGYNR